MNNSPSAISEHQVGEVLSSMHRQEELASHSDKLSPESLAAEAVRLSTRLQEIAPFFDQSYEEFCCLSAELRGLAFNAFRLVSAAACRDLKRISKSSTPPRSPTTLDDLI
jgi:hypothetical protein